MLNSKEQGSGLFQATRGLSSALVIEDEPHVLEITAQILRTLGHQVLEASTFEAALGMWREHAGSFSILIIDYNLGPRLGIDLINRFVKENSQVPIILMTGFSLSALEIPKDLTGRLYYIEKPFTVKALKQVVDSAFGSVVPRD